MIQLGVKHDTQHNGSVVMLSVTYAESIYPERHLCLVSLMLIVINNPFILGFIMLSNIMLSVSMPNIVILIDVPPLCVLPLLTNTRRT